MKLDFSFWRSASTRRKRIYTFLFILVVAFLLTLIGSLMPISSSAAHQTVDPLNQTLNQNRANGTLPLYIFTNNIRICLIMFIPIVGPIFGFISFVSSGYAIGAISQIQGIPPVLNVSLELLTPVFWIEFSAYSLAISESIWLLRRIQQKRFWELRNTAILIGVCAGLLAVGAVVETWLISVGV